MKKNIAVLIMSFTMLFGCNSQTKKMDKKIVGFWKGNLVDYISKKNIEKMTMEFLSDGKLIYTIGEGNTQNIIKMNFRTEGNILFSKEINSDQNEDKATYRFEKDNLILNFEGQTIIFTRK